MLSDPFAPPAGRGGPQVIPRPESARLGGPAPWADLPAPERRPSFSAVVDAVRSHRLPVVVGGVPSEARNSAVVAVVYEEQAQPWILLTRRSPHLRSHAHEVSFPGGREDADDPDLWATALREAHEEIALDPASVEPIGELDRFITVGSRSLIHPFVAVATAPPAVSVASPEEVEAIVRVPIAELLRPEVWREEVWSWPGGGARALSFFEVEGDTIWGATGAMLRQLLGIITGTEAHVRYGPSR